MAKQPGDSGAVGVVPADEMVQKLKAAVAASSGTEIQVIARCEACQLEGLEAGPISCRTSASDRCRR